MFVVFSLHVKRQLFCTVACLTGVGVTRNSGNSAVPNRRDGKPESLDSGDSGDSVVYIYNLK